MSTSACTACVMMIMQIGHHFSKWGRVMDVVMVKDFGPLLNLASTATTLEQNRKAAETKLAHGRKAGAAPDSAAGKQYMRSHSFEVVPYAPVLGLEIGGVCTTPSSLAAAYIY